MSAWTPCSAWPRRRVGGRTPPRLPAADSGSRIEFREATFRYAREDAGVFGVSFSVQPGEFLGIVGETGSGKSTLLDLMVGLYAPQAGSAVVDGIDTREIDLSWLRRQIGFVPQEPQAVGRDHRRQHPLPDRARPVTRSCGRRCGTPSSTTSCPDFRKGSKPRWASMGTECFGRRAAANRHRPRAAATPAPAHSGRSHGLLGRGHRARAAARARVVAPGSNIDCGHPPDRNGDGRGPDCRDGSRPGA